MQPEEEQALASETKTLVSSVPVPPQQAPELAVGTTFAERYEILAHLGKGGMSTVYKARDLKDDKLVALKMMLPHLLQEADSLKRFEREATSIGTLKHDNILEVHAYAISATGLPYIVMEYLVGAPLSAVIEKEKWLPYGRAVRIFIQIADALAHAHAKGVIHRDLKPSNVLLTDKVDHPDFVGIVDFGLAKLMPHANVEASSVTNTGDIFGSPPYMSPEQCQGKKVDTRADIYSFGCLMYETLTGRPPLLGENAVTTILLHISDMPAPMSNYAPDAKVPPKLEAIIFKSLDKDPLSRQQSMAELLRELKDFICLQETGMEYKPIGIKTMVRQRYARSKRVTLAAAGIAGVILLVAVAWWWDWINDYRDGTFRLIGSAAIAAVLGYGLFKLIMLDRRMKTPQVETVIPAISWHEFSPESNVDSVRAEVDEMLALLQDSKLPDDRQTHKRMRSALEALLAVKATEDVNFKSQQGIDVLQKQGKQASELALVLKEALADTLVLRKDYSRAEAMYREIVDSWGTDDDFAQMARTMVQLKLADVLYMENRTSDAQTLYSAFLFRSDVLALPKDSQYALRISRLADCYCSMESFKLAEEHYVKARELWQHLGDNANASLAFVKYAYTCQKRWKPIEIAEDFSTAVKTIEDSFGKESKHNAAAMGLYSSILWKEKRFDAAVKYRKQADEIAT